MGIRDDILADLLPEMESTGELFDAVEVCTFKRVTLGGWDENNMRPLPSTEQEFSSRGFLLAFDIREVGFSVAEYGAAGIQKGDVKFIVMTDQERPLQTETLIINGDKYHIVDILKFPTDVGSAYWLRRIGV